MEVDIDRIQYQNLFAHKFQACAGINLYDVLHGWEIVEPVKEKPPGDSDRSRCRQNASEKRCDALDLIIPKCCQQLCSQQQMMMAATYQTFLQIQLRYSFFHAQAITDWCYPPQFNDSYSLCVGGQRVACCRLPSEWIV